MVLRSSRQSRLTVATKFLAHVKPRVSILRGRETHCSTGTMPLIPCCWPAPGVAAGVAGMAVACPFACPLAMASFESEGGVKSPAPPGNERDCGDVKALACSAVDGRAMRVSIRTLNSGTALCRGGWLARCTTRGVTFGTAFGFGVLRAGPEEVVGSWGWKTTGAWAGGFSGTVGRTGLKGAISTVSRIQETYLRWISRRRWDWNCSEDDAWAFGGRQEMGCGWFFTHRESWGATNKCVPQKRRTPELYTPGSLPGDERCLFLAERTVVQLSFSGTTACDEVGAWAWRRT